MQKKHQKLPVGIKNSMRDLICDVNL